MHAKILGFLGNFGNYCGFLIAILHTNIINWNYFAFSIYRKIKHIFPQDEGYVRVHFEARPPPIMQYRCVKQIALLRALVIAGMFAIWSL